MTQTQTITSAKTSINTVPKLFKKMDNLLSFSSSNLDYGGGKYDTATKYLKEHHNIDNYVYDPYNRSKLHNHMVMSKVDYHSITCCNVLNVVDDETMIDIVQQLRKLAKNQKNEIVPVFIQVYEGNKSGVRKTTTKGQQRNQRAEEYEGLLKMIFSSVSRKGNIFTCIA